MKATVTFLPKANSPSFVAGPSAIMSPFLTLSLTLTMVFDLWNNFKKYKGIRKKNIITLGNYAKI